jgi:hypothetical protein
LRDVVAHCVYGVDKNAMAVELARMALWLETMEPGKPLAFLDHHLVHGDGILGVQDPTVLEEGIPAEAYDALTGDDREVVRALKRANASALKVLQQERRGGQQVLALTGRGLAQSLAAVDRLPDDTLEQVAAKREALAAARAQQDGNFRLACDAYVAAFLLRKDRDSEGVVPTTAMLRDLALGIAPSAAMREAIEAEAAAAPFLHWPVAFAPVMARGGFDCVVGNPPWEKIKLSEKEFFASRAPAIANAPNAAARERAIAALAREAPGTPERRLHAEYLRALKEVEGASRYARTGGRFPLTGTGDVNLYALFAEGALRVVRRGGRAGVVVPSGIASDAGTAPFFRHLAEGRLVSLMDFENREALFAGVHRSYKFSLLTMGEASQAEFAFFLTQPAQRHDRRRRFVLTPEDLRRLNPNTGNAPVFRSQADAELTAKIYRNVPVLWDETREDGNPWGLSFGTLFHMSNDSGLFHTRPGPGLVPLYEAKMIHQFDHRFGSFASRGGERGYRVLPSTSQEDYSNAEYEPQPFYWVDRDEVDGRLRGRWGRGWYLVFKDVTSATNERTAVATVIPAVGCNHKLPIIFFDNRLDPSMVACFLACMNSLVFDYVARQKVGGLSLGFFIMKQLPMPKPNSISNDLAKMIVTRVHRLTYTSKSLDSWSRDLGSEEGLRPWSQVERTSKRAELEALCAKLYGLGRQELEFVLDPESVMGLGYPTETFRILKNDELAAFGEFRTKRLVLEAWDRLFGRA